MNRSILGLLLTSCLLLGGCWQANGSLYPKADPVTPFHAGALTMTGKDLKSQHFALTLDANHSYRMIGTDKGTDEYVRCFAFDALTAAASCRRPAPLWALMGMALG